MSRRPTLPTRLLVNAFRTGDNAGWYYERSVLEEIHADRLAELRDDIGRSGIREPIRHKTRGRRR